MDTNIELLLRQICKEYGVSENEAIPSIKILHQNFFYKLKDLKNINFEIWSSMNLPINLFFILQGKINLIESQTFNPFIQNTNIEPIKLKEIPVVEEKLVVDKKDLVNEVKDKVLNLNEKSKEIRILEINNILENLILEINDIEKSKEILKTIHKIILNIINKPEEQTFRRIKVSNKLYKQSIEAYKNAFKFLQHSKFDFSSDGQFLEFIGDINYLTGILEKLDDFLISKGFVELNFNPYKTSITSMSMPIDDMKKVINATDWDQLLKQEKSRRIELIKSSTKTERKPIIFFIEGLNLGNIISELNNEIESEKSDSKFMNIIKKAGAFDENFKLKSRIDYENLVSTPIYLKAHIRIKFPNEILLQGSFALLETIGDICNFIRDNMLDPNIEFYITTSPPLIKYLDMKATIHSQKLAPSTLMYINFPSITNPNNLTFLKEESIRNYKKELIL